MSFVRSTQGLRRATVLIGLVAMTATAVVLPAAAAGGPRSHHLQFRLSSPKHQDMVGEGAILIRARCLGEPCTVVASAKSEQPRLHTGKARASIGADEAETLSLPLAKRQRGKLKAALEAGHIPVFKVEAIARDRAGTKVPLAIEVRPEKPRA